MKVLHYMINKPYVVVIVSITQEVPRLTYHNKLFSKEIYFKLRQFAIGA